MLSSRQKDRVIKLLKHAKENVPYYMEILKDFDLNEFDYEKFSKIKFLDKIKLRNNYNKIMTLGVNDSELLYEYTSGSTGIPMRYNRSKFDRLSSSFPLMRKRKEWIGEVNLLSRNAQFSHRVNDVTASMNEGWLGLWLRELTDEVLKEQCKRLIEFKPQILAGPPQALSKLAIWIIENNIDMTLANIKLVECRSEYLFEGQRKLVEKAFKCSAVNMYGCHEVWGIAYECSEKKLHIMEDSVILEVINEKGEHVGENEIGEVVVTGLTSMTMPIIRYKLGDRARYHFQKCCCNNNQIPWIELIGSRYTEWIKTPNGSVATAVFQPLNYELSKKKYDMIIQFQIVQRKLDEFDFIILTEGNIPNEFEKFIKDEMEKALGYSIFLNLKINKKFYTNSNSLKLSWFFSQMN